jgi:hypothetical protein
MHRVDPTPESDSSIMLSNLSLLGSTSWPWVMWALHRIWRSSALIRRGRISADVRARAGDAGSGTDPSKSEE